MFFSPTRPFCRACNRNLPRAASRCPWCKTPSRLGGHTAPAFHNDFAEAFAGDCR